MSKQLYVFKPDVTGDEILRALGSGSVSLACHDPSCAPPPAGTGGSRKGGSIGNRIADILKERPGATLNPRAGYKDVTSGYVVSERPDLSFERPLGELSAEAIDGWLAENRKVLNRAGNNVGVWHDQDTGQVWLDVVRVYPATAAGRKQAVASGMKHNQIAIYHLDAGDEIQIGGTGKAISAALVAACHSKECAPPPAGAGGSIKGSDSSETRNPVWDKPSDVPVTTSIKARSIPHVETDRLTRRAELLDQIIVQGYFPKGRIGFATRMAERDRIYKELVRRKVIQEKDVPDPVELGRPRTEGNAPAFPNAGWNRRDFEGFAARYLATLACHEPSCAPPPAGTGGSSKLSDAISRVRNVKHRPVGRSAYRPGRAKVGDETPQTHPDKFSTEDLKAEVKYLQDRNWKRKDPKVQDAVAKLLSEVSRRGREKREIRDGVAASIVAACHSKECAPPPVGNGGSKAAVESSNGISIYEVGGAVRDEIMGIDSDDVDYTVTAPSYEAMKKHLEDQGFRIFQEKPEFATIKAQPPEGHPLRDRTTSADFVLARRDGPSSDGRRPDYTEPGSLEDDLARRDFTVNAIAKDSEGNLVDPHGGQQDIESKTLRFVGDPITRVREDGLRVLRGFRFMVTKDLTPDPPTWAALTSKDAADMLGSVSKERVATELGKMLDHDTPAAIKLLGSLPDDTLNAIFPDGIRLAPSMKKKGKKGKGVTAALVAACRSAECAPPPVGTGGSTSGGGGSRRRRGQRGSAGKRSIPLQTLPDTPEMRKPGAVDNAAAELSRANPDMNVFVSSAGFGPGLYGSTSVLAEDISQSSRDGYWRNGEFKPFTEAARQRADRIATQKADAAMLPGGDGAKTLARESRQRQRARDKYRKSLDVASEEHSVGSRVKLYGTRYRKRDDGSWDGSTYNRDTDTFTESVISADEFDALRVQKRDETDARSSLNASALIAACHSKECAPPPVGNGGSSGVKGSAVPKDDGSSSVGERRSVYFNINLSRARGVDLWSLKDSKGRVTGHATQVHIDSPVFAVGAKGRERVLSEGSKNVHAYVRGTVKAVNGATPKPGSGGWREAYYNPFKVSTFVDRETGEPLNSAREAVLIAGKKVYYR